MRAAYTAQQVRDAEAGLLARTAEGALMRRAAFGLAVHARRMLGESGAVAGAPVALLVGAGNNGGDALWAGVELRRRGVGVDAVLLVRTGPTRPDWPPCAGPVAGPRGGPAARAAVARADLVLDGIVGISGRGGLRAPAPDLVDAVRRAGVPVLAVDLPSGVDPDTGASRVPRSPRARPSRSAR